MNLWSTKRARFHPAAQTLVALLNLMTLSAIYHCHPLHPRFAATSQLVAPFERAARMCCLCWSCPITLCSMSDCMRNSDQQLTGSQRRIMGESEDKRKKGNM